MRDKTNLFKGQKARECPTFHEIRSLGGYLYEKAGYGKSTIRRLMGHTEEYMTNYYWKVTQNDGPMYQQN
ncbi:hypothetical protein [Spartinivicinus poritis]|uniref:Tyr recombinase domain-containing protein n=1 Tax=Spartinivicinus poritis TaxID=2994640 RepID=A0ABT5UHD7_9GAMM|nr:hypothetical protein [Spartinivicinus sp. A2-2]MDE1465773.1 hypothetical protein [Spartinivicinus sp. A2-2]